MLKKLKISPHINRISQLNRNNIIERNDKTTKKKNIYVTSKILTRTRRLLAFNTTRATTTMATARAQQGVSIAQSSTIKCNSSSSLRKILLALVIVSLIDINCYASFLEDLKLLATDVQPLIEESVDVDIVNSDRFSLLERYVIYMSRELKETQDRVKELEDERPIMCTFNNTKYADQAMWKNGCETCKCQLGVVQCQPGPCLVLCDDAVMVPGKCCPICFKRCKYNGATYSHGNKVSSTSSRICKCNDGHIQCEKSPSLPSIRMTLSNSSSSSNDTIASVISNSQQTTTTASTAAIT